LMAIFLVPFTCVWAGGSLSGIYGKQIASGHLDPSSSLFGLPFLIGSCFLICLCAMVTTGKVTVCLSSGRLIIFTGVGSIGWTRSYSWSDFQTVREEAGYGSFNWSGRGQAIALEGKRKVTFGSMWSEDGRYFVLNVLRRELRTRAGSR
jgi:hypothetical protein